MAIGGEDPSTFRSRLDIFDWKGNYLCKAHLDKWVSSFSIDERNQTMYAVTADDMLVRYNIKELLDQLPNGFSSSYNSPILCIEFNEEYGVIIQIIHLIYKEFLRKSLSLHVPK